MTDNLQDYISFFRAWPFNSYYSKAVGLRKRRDAYVLRLNQEIEAKLQAGTHQDCLYAKNMASAHPLPVKELSTVLLTFLSGGLATASSTIHWSLTLLATRPDIQDTAYKAIRKVYANDQQLFEACMVDREEIPYISALVRESLRFVLSFPRYLATTVVLLTNARYYTPSRLALPRLTVQPFQYEGKVIPEGTTVILNTFACNMGKYCYYASPAYRSQIYPNFVLVFLLQTPNYSRTLKPSVLKGGLSTPICPFSVTVWVTACVPAILSQIARCMFCWLELLPCSKLAQPLRLMPIISPVVLILPIRPWLPKIQGSTFVLAMSIRSRMSWGRDMLISFNAYKYYGWFLSYFGNRVQLL